jgi:hypothetical protein
MNDGVSLASGQPPMPGVATPTLAMVVAATRAYPRAIL